MIEGTDINSGMLHNLSLIMSCSLGSIAKARRNASFCNYCTGKEWRKSGQWPGMSLAVALQPLSQISEAVGREYSIVVLHRPTHGPSFAPNMDVSSEDQAG
jgi:hypothetical protein